MKLTKTSDNITVQCSYHPSHIRAFRSFGGRWQAPEWVFPLTIEGPLTAYLDEQFGLGECDTDVMVEEQDAFDGMSVWHGYVLCSRRGRDYAVRMVDAAGCDTTLPASGGSVKSPRVNVPSGAKFSLRIPRAFAERHGLIHLTQTAKEKALAEIRKIMAEQGISKEEI